MAEYKITKPEMETVITFNEYDENAIVFTYNKRLISRLNKLIEDGETSVKMNRINSEYDDKSMTYEVPKKWIKVNPPRKVNLTEEQRAARSERMRKARERSIDAR